MKKMIDELWDGEISPQDTLISDNQEYRELQHRQSQNKAELLEALSGINDPLYYYDCPNCGCFFAPSSSNIRFDRTKFSFNTNHLREYLFYHPHGDLRPVLCDKEYYDKLSRRHIRQKRQFKIMYLRMVPPSKASNENLPKILMPQLKFVYMRNYRKAFIFRHPSEITRPTGQSLSTKER